MPAHNLIPVLFPKAKKDDLYDRINDLIQIYTGDLGNAPSSVEIQEAIDKQQGLCDSTVNPNNRRDCEKKINALEKQKETIEGDETKFDSAGIKERLGKKLNDVESELANDPYSYTEVARQLYRMAFTEMDNILSSVPEENYKNYKDIGSYKNLLEEYKDKAEELNVVSTAMKSGDEDTLRYYGVYYNSNPSGVLSMAIGPTTKKPSGSKATNLKTPEGLPVYLTDPQALDESYAKKVMLGDKEFSYFSVNGSFRVQDPETFNWDSVKKRNVAAASWGDFLQDSKGSKYFVNKEQKLAPVSDDMFTELGGNENKLQKMTSWEEENDLPSLRTSSIQPVTPRLREAMDASSQSEYEAEKIARSPSVRMARFLGMGGLKDTKAPGKGPMPSLEEFKASTSKKYGTEKYLPPREKESVEDRTKSIIESEY